MAPKTGLGAQLYVDGYDLSGDTQSLQRVGGGMAVLDKTAINQYATARRGGIRDGAIEWVSHFNKATDQQHDALKTLPITDRHLMYGTGTVLGAVAAALVAKQVNYDATRTADGDLTFSLSAQSNLYGFEFGNLLTAGKRTDATGTNGTGVDMGAGVYTFGAQFWLQVFAFTGTSVTVKIQSSTDNGVGDAWADVVGGGFTAATARGVQRIATAGNQTVERYLRVVTSGTFTNAVFAVMATVNEATVTP